MKTKRKKSPQQVKTIIKKEKEKMTEFNFTIDENIVPIAGAQPLLYSKKVNLKNNPVPIAGTQLIL